MPKMPPAWKAIIQTINDRARKVHTVRRRIKRDMRLYGGRIRLKPRDRLNSAINLLSSAARWPKLSTEQPITSYTRSITNLNINDALIYARNQSAQQPRSCSRMIEPWVFQFDHKLKTWIMQRTIRRLFQVENGFWNRLGSIRDREHGKSCAKMEISVILPFIDVGSHAPRSHQIVQLIKSHIHESDGDCGAKRDSGSQYCRWRSSIDLHAIRTSDRSMGIQRGWVLEEIPFTK